MQRRSMFLFGAAAIAVGIVVFIVTRGPSEPADQPTATASAPERVGALTLRDTKELQAKQREWAERIKQTPTIAEVKSDVPPMAAPPPTNVTVQTNDHVARKPADVAKARAEATAAADAAAAAAADADGRRVLTDKERMVDKLTRPRERVEDKVKGATAARDAILSARCKAPDAQQKFSQLGAGERMKMRAACAKYGVQLTE